MAFPQNIDELRGANYSFEGDATCKACHADIEWWKTPKGKKIPMNARTAIPHWSTCPNAEDFRKPKSGRSTHETLTE